MEHVRYCPYLLKICEILGHELESVAGNVCFVSIGDAGDICLDDDVNRQSVRFDSYKIVERPGRTYEKLCISSSSGSSSICISNPSTERARMQSSRRYG